mmetsp:Transcript_3658/g.6690  ORF Transcript_3658/g.6690 Transcript_3658/m.6690 type:complete len:450 (-) Transcript_3658:141-1490(-)
MIMMRLVIAALAATSTLARWGDPDRIKEMAARAIDRRHNLAERHQKGDEIRRTLTKEKQILTNEQKESAQTRVLKRSRDVDDGKKHKSAKEEKVDAKEEKADVMVEAAAVKPAGQDDSSKGKMKNLKLTAANKGKGSTTTSERESKTGKSPPAPGKSPSNEKRPSTPSSPESPSSPTSPSPPTSKTGKAGDENPSSKTDKGSGKSRKVSSGICTKRLRIAYDEITALGEDGPFGLIESPSDVTDLCYFNPPNEEDEDFNFGCPFVYVPDMGFIKGVDGYVEIFGEEAGEAFQSLVMYCECYQGFELGCAAKIPHGPPTTTKEYEDAEGEPKEVLVNGYSEFIPFSTPADRADYCTMVGVWNGDFDSDITQDFSQDVTDCGCYFVGQAQDMVDQCPGVDLGVFFVFPEPLSSFPTYLPTPSPTDEPTSPWPTFSPTESPFPTYSPTSPPA